MKHLRLQRRLPPAAAVFFTGGSGYYEIYGTSFADGAFRDDIFRALMTAALGECASLGAKYLTCLCGDDERRVLPELGFRCVGQYVLKVYPKTRTKIVF